MDICVLPVHHLRRGAADCLPFLGTRPSGTSGHLAADSFERVPVYVHCCFVVAAVVNPPAIMGVRSYAD